MVFCNLCSELVLMAPLSGQLIGTYSQRPVAGGLWEGAPVRLPSCAPNKGGAFRKGGLHPEPVRHFKEMATRFLDTRD